MERFRTLTRNYYRNAHAAVFVYSMSEASSLHYLAQWIRDTESFAPNATRMLVGNKSDLESLGEIDETTAHSFATAHKFELHFKTSCKTNEGIGDAFTKLAQALHKPETLQSELRRPSGQGSDDVLHVGGGGEGAPSTSTCKC